jgi:hypothetical protein
MMPPVVRAVKAPPPPSLMNRTLAQPVVAIRSDIPCRVSLAGGRVPLLQKVAVVTIQLRDFSDLREPRSPKFRESHAGVSIALNQGVASVFAALPQRKRYF